MATPVTPHLSQGCCIAHQMKGLEVSIKDSMKYNISANNYSFNKQRYTTVKVFRPPKRGVLLCCHGNHDAHEFKYDIFNHRLLNLTYGKNLVALA